MTSWAGASGRLPTVLWLFAVWQLLWWHWDVTTLLTGVLFSLAIVMIFPMPRIGTPFVVRPLRLIVLAGFELGDITLSAIRVARDSVWRPRHPGAAIIAVEIFADVDHAIVIAANLLTLTPGTFVLEIDRGNRTFYIYALGTRTQSDVDQVRQTARRLQMLVVKAFGDANAIESARKSRRDFR